MAEALEEAKRRLIGELVTTGNEELDLRLGGGIPIPNLLVVEGGHGTGKSVIAQQISFGALRQGYRVTYVTTEKGVRELVMQAKKVSLDITDEFLKGMFNPVPLHVKGVKWTPEKAKRLINALNRYMWLTVKRYDVFIVDSLTPFVSYYTKEDVLNLLSSMRSLVALAGKLVILTIHPDILPQEIATELRAAADTYIRLEETMFGGRLIKVMKIAKMRGTPGFFESTIAFEVDPAFGIKVIPVALAKA